MNAKTILILVLAVLVAVGATWAFRGGDLKEEIRARKAEIVQIKKSLEDLQDEMLRTKKERDKATERFEKAERDLIVAREQHESKVAELDKEIGTLQQKRNASQARYRKLYEAIRETEDNDLAVEVESSIRTLGQEYETSEFALFTSEVFPENTFRANRPAAEGVLYSLLRVGELDSENQSLGEEADALRKKVQGGVDLSASLDVARAACVEDRGVCNRQLELEQEAKRKLQRALGLSEENVEDLEGAIRSAKVKRWLQTIGAAAAGYAVGGALD